MRRGTIVDRAATLTATFFGTGYAPVASGTVASAAAVPLYLALALLPTPAAVPAAQIAALIAVTLGGIAASAVTARRIGVHDPSEVVIDEVAGFLLTMLLVPPGILTITAGFLLFRILDIIKPWPAGAVERLPGGWGIMADDLVCGLYANAVLHIGLRFLG